MARERSFLHQTDRKTIEETKEERASERRNGKGKKTGSWTLRIMNGGG